MSNVPDLRALAEQQRMEREAAEHGMAPFPLIGGIQPTDEGMAVFNIVMGACTECGATVQQAAWSLHQKWHTDQTVIADDDADA